MLIAVAKDMFLLYLFFFVSGRVSAENKTTTIKHHIL
jgi:hypothetical protein